MLTLHSSLSRPTLTARPVIQITMANNFVASVQELNNLRQELAASQQALAVAQRRWEQERAQLTAAAQQLKDECAVCSRSRVAPASCCIYNLKQIAGHLV